MPGWSRPSDIWFDHAAAVGAVEAVAALRYTVAMSWGAETAAAQEALVGWHGMAAEAFATSFAARRNATSFADQDLARLQSSIELAIDDAVRAQRRIDSLQADWDAERAAEVRAQQGAANEPAGDGAGGPDDTDAFVSHGTRVR